MVVDPRPALRACAIAGLLLAAASPASATDAREIRARKAFVAGHLEEAIDLFAQLYAETLHPNYLRNLGRCHQRLGHTREAIDFFHDYLEKGRSIDAAERSEIEGYIAAMEALGRQQATAPAPVAAPTAVPAAVLAPQPAPPPAIQAEISRPPAAPPEKGSALLGRWWFWTGVAAVVAAAAVGAVALSGQRTVMPSCPVGVDCAR